MLFVSYKCGHPCVSVSAGQGDMIVDGSAPRSAADVEWLKETIARRFSEENPVVKAHADDPTRVSILFWAEL